MVGANAESGISRVGKIDMKEPGVDLGQGNAAGEGLSMASTISSLPAGGGSPVRKFAATKL